MSVLVPSSVTTKCTPHPRQRSTSPAGGGLQRVSHAGILLQGRYRITHEAPLVDDGFSVIYRARDAETKIPVAVKIYRDDSPISFGKFCSSIEFLLTMRGRFNKMGRVDREPNLKLILEELHKHGDITSYATAYTTLSQMNFRSVFVELLGYSRDELWNPKPDPETGLHFIIFELGKETLKDVLNGCLNNQEKLAVQELRNIHWALVSIVCGLQSEGYVHLDIKPAGLMRYELPDGYSTWKLMDLDGAALLSRKVRIHELSFSTDHAPPELARSYLQRQRDGGRISLTPTMNVWSAGMCALEAALLLPVFELKFPWFRSFREEGGSDGRWLAALAGNGGRVRPDSILQGELREDLDILSPEMCAFLEGMLNDEPSKRLCISQCVVHRWLEPRRRALLDGSLAPALDDLQLMPFSKESTPRNADDRSGGHSETTASPGSPTATAISSPSWSRPDSPVSGRPSQASTASRSCAVM
mmetsp:Transcript_1491/g.3808  ORF Transcript_1491/g.3808 Transcript_1491/m.3808 type:complete len:473 (+) Transcript_1491:64-1482(+)